MQNHHRCQERRPAFQNGALFGRQNVIHNEHDGQHRQKRCVGGDPRNPSVKKMIEGDARRHRKNHHLKRADQQAEGVDFHRRAR